MSEFVSAAPPTGGITWADHKGALLVIEPVSIETGIKTTFGDADAIKANVYVLTGANESQDFPDCLIFPKLLSNQLRSQIGKRVVGRLANGAAKPGQSAPWLLDAASDDDLKKATDWLANRSQPAVTSAQAPF